MAVQSDGPQAPRHPQLLKRVVNILALDLGWCLSMSGVFINISTTTVAATEWKGAAYATLPVGMQIFCSALTVVPLGRLAHHYGRRPVFILAPLLAVVGSLIMVAAAWKQQYGLLVLGAFLQGPSFAIANNFRFVSAEFMAGYPAEWRARAISVTVGMAVFAAALGPEAARSVRDNLDEPYAGAYVLVAGLYLAQALIIGCVAYGWLAELQLQAAAAATAATTPPPPLTPLQSSADSLAEPIKEPIKLQHQPLRGIGGSVTAVGLPVDSSGQDAAALAAVAGTAAAVPARGLSVVESASGTLQPGAVHVAPDPVGCDSVGCDVRLEVDGGGVAAGGALVAVGSSGSSCSSRGGGGKAAEGEAPGAAAGGGGGGGQVPLQSQLQPQQLHQQPQQQQQQPEVPQITLRSLFRVDFLMPAVAGAVAFCNMAGLMVSTPIAMKLDGHSFDQSTWTIEAHIVSMFLPSMLVGDLIQVLRSAASIAPSFIRHLLLLLPFPFPSPTSPTTTSKLSPATATPAAAPALFPPGSPVSATLVWGGLVMIVSNCLCLGGSEVGWYMAGLSTLGLGWALVYVGASSLVTGIFVREPHLRLAVQGGMDTLVVLGSAASNTLSGPLVRAMGWQSFLYLNVAANAALTVWCAAYHVIMAKRWRREVQRAREEEGGAAS